MKKISSNSKKNINNLDENIDTCQCKLCKRIRKMKKIAHKIFILLEIILTTIHLVQLVPQLVLLVS